VKLKSYCVEPDCENEAAELVIRNMHYVWLCAAHTQQMRDRKVEWDTEQILGLLRDIPPGDSESKILVCLLAGAPDRVMDEILRITSYNKDDLKQDLDHLPKLHMDGKGGYYVTDAHGFNHSNGQFTVGKVERGEVP